MERLIGLDAHASSCTLGVVSPGGKRVGSHLVETNARCLIEAVRQSPEPRHVFLEEATLSGRLYEVLSPHAERVVMTAVRESRGPKDAGYPREAWVGDAFGLAEALRLGAIERSAYRERGGFREMGDRARGYRGIRDDTRSSRFVAWSLVLPGAVSFIPYPTSLLAEHPEQPLSVVVFYSTYLVAGLALGRVRHFGGGDAGSGPSVSSRAGASPAMLLIVTTAFLSCPLAWVDARLGAVLWFNHPITGGLVRHAGRGATAQNADARRG